MAGPALAFPRSADEARESTARGDIDEYVLYGWWIDTLSFRARLA